MISYESNNSNYWPYIEFDLTYNKLNYNTQYNEINQYASLEIGTLINKEGKPCWPTNNTGFTFSCWIYIDNLLLKNENYEIPIWTVYNQSKSKINFSLAIKNNNIMIKYQNKKIEFCSNNNSELIVANHWYNIIITCSKTIEQTTKSIAINKNKHMANIINLYINGIKIGQKVMIFNTSYNLDSFICFFGTNEKSTNDYINAKRIKWRLARSLLCLNVMNEEQIANFYNTSGDCNENNSYWPIEISNETIMTANYMNKKSISIDEKKLFI